MASWDDDPPDFSWPEMPDPQDPCDYAGAFQAFCDGLHRQLEQTPSAQLEPAVAIAKLNLIDRYGDYLTDTPPNHANAAGRRKHRCIVDVLNDALKQIRLVQRSRIPPRLGFGLAAQDDPPAVWNGIPSRNAEGH